MRWALTGSVGALSMLLAHCTGCHLAALTTPAHAEHASHEAHRHLLPVASGAFVLAVVALLSVAVAVHRHHRSPRLRLGRVLLVQLAAFAVVHLAQLIVGGVHNASLLANESLFTLLVQPSIAILVFWLCRRAMRAVERLFERRRSAPPRRAPAIQRTPSTRHHPASLHWALSAARRGPPISAFGLS